LKLQNTILAFPLSPINDFFGAIRWKTPWRDGGLALRTASEFAWFTYKKRHEVIWKWVGAGSGRFDPMVQCGVHARVEEPLRGWVEAFI